MRVLLALCTLLAWLPLSAAEKLQVVTSFSIIEDINRTIAGDKLQIHNLIGADADAHLHEPNAKDAKAVLGARVLH